RQRPGGGRRQCDTGSRGETELNRRQQFLHLPNTQICSSHFERCSSTELRMRAHQELGGSFVVPHILGHRHDPRKTLEPLAFGRRKPGSTALECCRWSDEIPQRLKRNRIVLRKMREHGLDRSLGQPLGYQLVELDQRTNPMLQDTRPSKYFRHAVDVDHRSCLWLILPSS